MAKDMMKVGRLKSILAKYDNNAIIYLYGGEGAEGDFACLLVAKKEEERIWDGGDLIMLYENQRMRTRVRFRPAADCEKINTIVS